MRAVGISSLHSVIATDKWMPEHFHLTQAQSSLSGKENGHIAALQQAATVEMFSLPSRDGGYSSTAGERGGNMGYVNIIKLKWHQKCVVCKGLYRKTGEPMECVSWGQFCLSGRIENEQATVFTISCDPPHQVFSSSPLLYRFDQGQCIFSHVLSSMVAN